MQLYYFIKSVNISWFFCVRQLPLRLWSLNPLLLCIRPVQCKCRYVSWRADNTSMIHRNPESSQLIGCRLLPLVGMDLLDKSIIL